MYFTMYWEGGGGGEGNNFMLSLCRSLQDLHQNRRPHLSRTATSQAKYSPVVKRLKVLASPTDLLIGSEKYIFFNLIF